MRFLSVCSGIEAASVAWEPIGWQALAFSEVEAFPSAVLAHHYPSVPNLGDMTRHEEWPDLRPDVLVGGTPCQSFSMAGKRAGIDDQRGALAISFGRVAARYRPRWVVWENVPGVLSSGRGRDFASFVGGLVKLGYCCSWRVLDAQYFGLAQRRRRVFVVGHLGDWRASASVLFERACGSGDFEASETKESCFDSGLRDGAKISRPWPAKIACTLYAEHGSKMGLENQHAHGSAALFVPTTFCASSGQSNASVYIEKFATITAKGDIPIVGTMHGTQNPIQSDKAMTIGLSGRENALLVGGGLRRMTPTEHERLQGFPDGYTDIPGSSDAARYKALGNSMAVPVMRWIGRRIDAADERH